MKLIKIYQTFYKMTHNWYYNITVFVYYTAYLNFKTTRPAFGLLEKV